MNTDELEWALVKAGRRVLEIQTKLHGWAVADPHRRFDDLINLVADPAFLLIAWDRCAATSWPSRRPSPPLARKSWVSIYAGQSTRN